MPPTPRPRIPVAVAAGILCAAVLTAAPAHAAPALTVTAPVSAQVDETVPVTVTLGDLTDVYAYEVSLAVDTDTLVPGSVGAGPDGGFDAVVPTDDGVTLVHTRLGTSPPLDGEVAVELELDAVAAGTAEIVVSAELVAPDGTTTSLDGTTTVTVSAAPTPEPTTEPTEEPTVEPTAEPTAEPTGEPGPTAGPTSPGSTGGAPPRAGGGSLPATGTSAGVLAASAALLLAGGGTALAVRARRTRAGAR